MGRKREKETGYRGKGVELCLGKERKKKNEKSHSVGKIQW